ncbi:dUTP diphosphatase [Paracholeplasma manati]|uniref:dUTP diphosphatase n=1 Tax=Paracholeplasma manati TaxID=591373 RepID=A0ABT2Y839_9MOLU|nr:dUTP diphosphatase [Paracholeplasma manati]MCV2232901.1 dUTP diphosphatase [Paracholeplasma manati]MDG0888660.1 dUTP diphosphatase [Paracholeplasma manati]
MRKFEKITTYQNQTFDLPKRATSHSAGYDLAAVESIEINPGDIQKVPTGLKVAMNDGEVLLVFPRSSLGLKKQLMMANNVGVIDQDYYNSPGNEGHIMIPIYNFGQTTQVIEKGERVAQGIFVQYLKADDDIASDEKRISGFGSTDK